MHIRITYYFRLLMRTFRLAGVHYLFYLYTIFCVFIAVMLKIVEPGLTSLLDSIWYCFAVITTVGFGDLVAITAFGRFLTMLLSLFSIIVLAIFTAVTTSFFLDIAKLNAQESIQAFVDDLENLPQLSQEELENLSRKIRQFKSPRS